MKPRATKAMKEKRILETIDYLIEGKSRSAIKQSLQVKYDLKRAQTDWYIRESTKRITEEFRIINKDQLDEASSLIASRMEKIYQRSIDNNQDKLALDTLIALQKLYGLGKDTLAIEKVENPYTEADTADLLSLINTENG